MLWAWCVTEDIQGAKLLLTDPKGYPEDLMVSVALGADMFDCVWPTRTAVCISI